MSLSDTVGFIRDLPHKLVEAFKATLQEAAEADLLLHVVDASSPMLDEQMAEVQRVLHEIGADRVPQVLVYNKLDRLEASQRPRELVDVDRAADRRQRAARLRQRVDGQGLDVLRGVLARTVAGVDRRLEAASRRRIVHDVERARRRREPRRARATLSQSASS